MIDLTDVQDARGVLDGIVHHTLLELSRTFSEMTGAEVYLKYENLQRTGSFKIRGAYNKIQNLSDEERGNGVIAASAGNHAQGVSLASTEAGINSKIVMPEDAPISKVDATRGYGAEVILHGVDYSEAYEKACDIQEEEGRTFIHAFDDPYVQAGQGTIGLEILEDEPDVDVVIVPIGGGGLISGIATAVKAESPDTRVIGVQAEGAASVPQSLEKGEIYERDSVSTICDGIATRSIEESTFRVIQERVDDVVTVSDDETANAILLLLERAKTVVEGAGAVTLAAALNRDIDIEDEKIVCVLSGGNIDSHFLSHVVNRGLINAGRYLKFSTVLKDKPGSLAEVVDLIAELDANIHAIRHDRMEKDIAVNAADVEFELETKSREHANRLIRTLEEEGYDVSMTT